LKTSLATLLWAVRLMSVTAWASCLTSDNSSKHEIAGLDENADRATPG